MLEPTNQLCGTVRGRRLTDSELVRVVRHILAEEEKPLHSSQTYTNAANDEQQVSITSSNQNQA
jgi:hypothetical protein